MKVFMKKYGILMLFVLAVVFIFYDGTIDRKREKKIEALKAEVISLQMRHISVIADFKKEKAIAKTVTAEKIELRKQFETYKKTADKKLREKVKEKTVVVNKTKLITVKDCVKISHEFTEEIKNRFSFYIDVDKPMDENIERIITDFEMSVSLCEKERVRQSEIIKLSEKRISKLLKRKRFDKILRVVLVGVVGYFTARAILK